VPIGFAFVDRFTFGAIGQLTALALADVYGVGARGSSLILLGFWTAFILGCVPAGRATRRFGSRRVLLMGSAAYGLSFLAMGSASLGAFALAMVAAGLFCAFQYVPTMARVAELADPRLRGASMGVWSTAGSLGLVTGMSVTARLIPAGYDVAYAVAGGLELVLVGAVVLHGFASRRAEALPTVMDSIRPPAEQP
jgi:MFS family permease